MKPKDALVYFTGWDRLNERRAAEQAVLSAYTGQEHNLPLDAGPRAAAGVYADRLKTVVTHPFFVLGRLGRFAIFGHPDQDPSAPEADR